jgi:hypothetical protein
MCGADTCVCGVETRLDALAGTGIETSLDAAA